MAEYLERFVYDVDELDENERLWRCPVCAAVDDRHHAEREYPFCPNCEHRDAVLIEMNPVGRGAEEVHEHHV